MDMRTGRTYATKEEALAAGVPAGDIQLLTGEQQEMLDELRRAPLAFKKGKPFATIKNRTTAAK